MPHPDTLRQKPLQRRWQARRLAVVLFLANPAAAEGFEDFRAGGPCRPVPGQHRFFGRQHAPRTADDRRHHALQLVNPRPQEFQPGNRRGLRSRAPGNALAEAAQREQRKSVIQDFPDHRIKIVPRQLS